MARNANALRLALFTVAIYAAALTVGLRLLYYLAYVLAAVLLAAFIWSQLNKRGLRVSRKVEPASAQVGQTVQETIEVQNLDVIRKLWLEVRDRSSLPGHQVGAVISLPARSSKRWRVRTRCLRRGLYRLGPTAVLTGDPFGLFQTSRIFDESAELLIYPPTVPLSSFGLPAGELPGGSQTQRRTFHSTPNAAGIREYLPGDPMNRIHWPVTARAQKLMVKEFELDPTADLWLILDLNEAVHLSETDVDVDDLPIEYNAPGTRPAPDYTRGEGQRSTVREDTSRLSLEPSTEEYAVAVTASLAAYFIGQGRSVGLIAWGQHHVVLPADRGGRQLIKILRALAVLRAEGTTSLGEVITAETQQFNRQDTLIVITPSLDDEWVAALQSQLYKGVKAAAALVEPGTFGGEENPLMLVSALSAISVPTYLIKRDDAIDAALSQQFDPQAARNLR